MRRLTFAPAFGLCLLSLLSTPDSAATEPPSLGPPELVGDLERVPSQSGSSPRGMVRMGAFVYFVATDPIYGQTLWRSDGTPAGTLRVAIPSSGCCQIDPSSLTPTDGKLFFTTRSEYDPSRSRGELWVTDGSPGDAHRIGRFRALSLSGAGSRPLSWLTPFGDRLLFVAGDGEHGLELWISDGTADGTELLADVCSGECSSTPRNLVTLDDRVYFVASGSSGPGRAIWSTDGRPGSLRQIGPVGLAPDSFGAGFLAHRGRLLFVFETYNPTGLELWALQPLDEHPRLLASIQSGRAPRSWFFPMGETVYVVIDDLGAEPGQPKVWSTDGTANGTRPAEAILSAGRIRVPGRMTALGSTLLFTVRDEEPSFGPGSLWILEPGAGEAHPLFDGSDGPDVPRVWDCCGPFGVVLGDRLLFAAYDPPGGLWLTDGTAGGTHRFEPTAPETHLDLHRTMEVLGDRVLFGWNDGVHGAEPWVTDGTPAGTRLLADISPPRSSSSPRELTHFDGHLYFLTDPGRGERSLWRTTDGGEATELVAAEIPHDHLTPVGAQLFLMDSGVGGTVGFGSVTSFDPGTDQMTPVPVASPIFDPTPGPNELLFYARGDELWATDGTSAGTIELYDAGPGDDYRGPLRPRGPPPVPYGLAHSGDHLFFVGYGEHGYELWRTDGTPAGTTLVSDSVGAPLGSAPLRGGLLFRSEDALAPYPGPTALWWSDGTPAGTRKLLETHPFSLTATERLGFFFVLDEEGGYRLWRTDGTPAGTVEVSRVGSPGVYTSPGQVTAAGDRLYFTLYTEELGTELWVSDGTSAGTHPVRDVRLGFDGSRPAHLTALPGAGDLLAFAADDGTGGLEPWITDGSFAGTVRIADLNPGPASSNPTGFAAVGNRVYFAADDGVVGHELWAVRLGSPGGPPPPVPPEATSFEPEELPGFRISVLITSGGEVQPSRREAACLPETVCVSGAVPGRSELFVRIVGPKPNGYLWPTLVRFSTSTIDVWIEQLATDALRHYRLDGVSPGESELPGLFDQQGFRP